MAEFDHQTVLVTGAASGIGQATAVLFHQRGANVVLVDRREDVLTDAMAAFGEERALAVTADVSRSEEVDRAVDAAIERFGGLDVLVNNAATIEEGPPDDFSDEQWRTMLDTDLSAAFYFVRASAKALKKSGGRIVFTASTSGIGADWNRMPYCAAKGGLVNMTKALALDLGGRGIRVNAVCPGFTKTGMTEDYLDDEAVTGPFIERTPLGRLGEAVDVAKVIAFLASEEAGFVTGAVIPVDGGITASNGQPKMV